MTFTELTHLAFSFIFSLSKRLICEAQTGNVIVTGYTASDHGSSNYYSNFLIFSPKFLLHNLQLNFEV